MNIIKNIPEFSTERLILRSVVLTDVSSYQKYFADYEIIKNLSKGVPWPYPEDGVKTFLENSIFPHQGKDQWLWGIFLKTNLEELVGGVHLWRESIPENRGFWLAKHLWGQGIMTEAVAPIMDYAFEELGFETLYFSNALGNIASRRVKEKTGAKLLRVDACPGKFVDPSLTHQEVWELHKEDWMRYRENK